MGRPQNVTPPQAGVHSELRERAEWAPQTISHLRLWHLGTRAGRTLVPSALPERPDSPDEAVRRVTDLPTLLFEARR
jgi:hypothetical protein